MAGERHKTRNVGWAALTVSVLLVVVAVWFSDLGGDALEAKCPPPPPDVVPLREGDDGYDATASWLPLGFRCVANTTRGSLTTRSQGWSATILLFSGVGVGLVSLWLLFRARQPALSGARRRSVPLSPDGEHPLSGAPEPPSRP